MELGGIGGIDGIDGIDGIGKNTWVEEIISPLLENILFKKNICWNLNVPLIAFWKLSPKLCILFNMNLFLCCDFLDIY